MPPKKMNDVGVFDMKTEHFTKADITVPDSSDDHFSGGVVGPDDNVYMIPYKADYIGVFNPFTSESSFISIRETIVAFKLFKFKF